MAHSINLCCVPPTGWSCQLTSSYLLLSNSSQRCQAQQDLLAPVFEALDLAATLYQRLWSVSVLAWLTVTARLQGKEPSLALKTEIQFRFENEVGPVIGQCVCILQREAGPVGTSAHGHREKCCIYAIFWLHVTEVSEMMSAAMTECLEAPNRTNLNRNWLQAMYAWAVHRCGA